MSELFVPISDHESSQLVGGLKVKLQELGPIGGKTDLGTQAVEPNQTVIRIHNESNYNLNYGIVYDGGFNDVKNATVAAGKYIDHSASEQPAAALGWDEDLAKLGTQMDLARLRAGYEYKFIVEDV